MSNTNSFGIPNMAGAVDLSKIGGQAASDDVTKTIDVYDSEINQIHKVLEVLRRRTASRREYDSVQREIIERFAEIGFKVDVRWYDTNQDDVKVPEINISGRIDKGFVFDRDQQVAEVTGDLLGLGEGGTIATDPAKVAAMMDGSYKGQADGVHKH